MPAEERSEGSGVGGISDKGDNFRPMKDDVILTDDVTTYEPVSLKPTQVARYW